MAVDQDILALLNVGFDESDGGRKMLQQVLVGSIMHVDHFVVELLWEEGGDTLGNL